MDERNEGALEALGVLVAQEPNPFVAGLLLLPDDAHFPDAFEPTEAGMSSLLHRLHQYLGISHVDVEVELDLDDASGDVERTEIALEFVEAQRAHYRVRRIDRADVVVAAVLEVALAAMFDQSTRTTTETYREPGGSPDRWVPDDDETFLGASLLAVARGAGVLLAIGAHTFRAGAEIAGGLSALGHWDHVERGALDPHVVSYLLAAQLVIRDDVDRPRVLAALPTERRREVMDALGTLDREEVAEVLGLPPRSAWPPPARPDEATTSRRPTPKRRSKPAGAMSFRLRSDAGALGAFLGAALGMAGIALTLWIAPSWSPDESVMHRVVITDDGAYVGTFRSITPAFFLGAMVLIVLVTGALGAAVGRRRVRDVCAAVGCGAPLAQGVPSCPRCGRRFAGVVRSRTELIERRWAERDGRE